MGVTANSVHKALQKKANRELSEQFVKEVEDKVRAEIWEEEKQRAMEFWMNKINHGLAKNMENVMLMVLRDNDGYGHDRALDRLIKFETVWGDIVSGRISQEDVDETVRAELRIAIEPDGIYRILKNGEMEKVVDFDYKE